MSKIEIAHELSVIAPNAEAHLDAVRPILRRGEWGDGVKAVCLMSAFVPGAKSFGDCVTAGWPEWLASLTATLYDADVGADDEKAEADRWAYRMAAVISRPINLVQAQHRFLIATLAPLVSLSPVVEPVINLHQRVLNDDAPLRREWEAAETDAWEAAIIEYESADDEYNAPYAAAAAHAGWDVVDTAVSATERAEAVWAVWEAADASVSAAWNKVDTVSATVKAAVEDDATVMLPWNAAIIAMTTMATARDNLIFILTGDRDE